MNRLRSWSRPLVRHTLLVLLALAGLPSAAYACVMCVGVTEEGRMAFVQTAVALSLLPLGMVGGVGIWLRRRSRSGSDDLGSSLLRDGERFGGLVGLSEEGDHRDGAEEVGAED